MQRAVGKLLSTEAATEKDLVEALRKALPMATATEVTRQEPACGGCVVACDLTWWWAASDAAVMISRGRYADHPAAVEELGEETGLGGTQGTFWRSYSSILRR